VTSSGDAADEPAGTQSAGTTGGAPVGPLPDAVRTRVIALAAESLGRMPVDQLPPPLKRVASFAPARRAKLAGNQIAGVLETDETFRERVAVQVRAQLPELAGALDEGTAPAAADPVELAALAYLLRPDGWEDTVTRGAQAVHAERSSALDRQTDEQLERLRRQLEDVQAELREARERSRQQVADLKAENSQLRHKLRVARARL
jgi:hypothetical protein